MDSSQSDQRPVQVLLATYNGERFLRQQLDSILAQTYTPLALLIRDDGSRDATPHILAEYAAAHPTRITLMPPSPGTGSAKLNFMQLLAASTAPYVALADQDDFWLPEKLTLEMAAMAQLEETHGPATPLLVFSDLAVVNDDLSPRHPSFWQHQGIPAEKIHSFKRLLTQNVVTGCTAVLNRPLIALTHPMPPDAFMHDWWIALVANAFGHAAIVWQPTVLYRQHGGNVVGALEAGRPNLIPKWRYHDKRREQWEMGSHTAQAFRQAHGTALPPEKQAILTSFLQCEESSNRLTRVAHYLFGGFRFNTFRGNLVMLWYLWDMNYSKQVDPPRG